MVVVLTETEFMPREEAMRPREYQQAVSDWEPFSELTESPIALQSVCDRELMISSSPGIARA